MSNNEPNPMDCDLDTSVPDWLIEHPETFALIQQLGIDYSCGGKSLRYACQERGLDAHGVLASLRLQISAANGNVTT